MITPIKKLELPDVDPRLLYKTYFEDDLSKLQVPILPISSSGKQQLMVKLICSKRIHDPTDDTYISKSRSDAGSILVTTNCKSFNFSYTNGQTGEIGGHCSYCFYKTQYALIPMAHVLIPIKGKKRKNSERKIRYNPDEFSFEISGSSKGYCTLPCMYKIALKNSQKPLTSTKHDWQATISNILRLSRIIYGEDYILEPARSKGLLDYLGGTKTREEWLRTDVGYTKIPTLIFCPGKDLYKTSQ